MLENVLPSSGVGNDVTSSYISFFSKAGVPFMKDDQNSDPEARLEKAKDKKIEYVANVSNVVKKNRHWGSLDSWTDLATSSLKRKESSFQVNRNSKKITPALNQKSSSKLSQIKAEIRSSNSSVRVEARRMNDSASITKPAPKLGPEKSPVKEKRSTKILDITSLNPISSSVSVIASQKKHIKLHDIDKFYRQILSWNIADSTSATPPGIGCLERPKDSYVDYQSYFDSFYPLFLTELWGQLTSEWKEHRSNGVTEIETQHVSHIGDFIGIFNFKLSHN